MMYGGWKTFVEWAALRSGVMQVTPRFSYTPPSVRIARLRVVVPSRSTKSNKRSIAGRSAGYAADVYQPELGKFKVPTLRNVDLRPSPDFVKAYGHNGYFKSLEEIVFFYHWRAMLDNGNCMMGGGGMGGGMMDCAAMQSMFPAPEVDLNRATLTMFSRPQVENIVAFLKTLSDGYFER